MEDFSFFSYLESVFFFWLYYNMRIWDGVGDVFRSMYWISKQDKLQDPSSGAATPKPHPPHSISILFSPMLPSDFLLEPQNVKKKKGWKKWAKCQFFFAPRRACRERLTTPHRNLVVLCVHVRVRIWRSVNGSPGKCDFLRPRTSVADDNGAVAVHWQLTKRQATTYCGGECNERARDAGGSSDAHRDALGSGG